MIVLHRHRRSLIFSFLLVFTLFVIDPAVLANRRTNPGSSEGLPHRRYKDGETLVYRMETSNQDATRLLRYEAECRGVVKRDSAGHFFVEYSWSRLNVNGHAIPLPASGFHQDVSLAPDFKLSVPNLSRVHPALIGPITDLLTFYADAQLAMRQDRLARTGDRVYVKNGRPNSWADGKRVLVGQDAIDFDIVFQNRDTGAGTATVLVRHVPPEKPKINLSARWMRVPVVGHAANNYVQISRSGDAYVASVGEETFDVHITLSLADGKILSASMVNPVEVVERKCADDNLTDCGAAKKYQIMRKVRIDLRRSH